MGFWSRLSEAEIGSWRIRMDTFMNRLCFWVEISRALGKMFGIYLL